MNGRRSDLQDFYALIGALVRLGGWRTLSTCTGRMAWPERGVYFFAEAGEDRSDSGTGPRIVRVGTHALKDNAGTTLWRRLSQHRGTVSTGEGNHRGSIFRLIVGSALISRDGVAQPTWGKGNHATKTARIAEGERERNVTATLGAMRLVCLPVPDPAGPASLRGYIERNAIALLSNHDRAPLDPPSPDWLGHHSDRERVRRSGLWNSNHVDEYPDGDFLRTLERLIVEAERGP